MTGKLALAVAAVLLSATAAALAQSTDATRPAVTRTPPTVEEITARLKARGLTDAQIAERIAALQAAIASGQRLAPPDGTRTPPTVEEITAKLKAEGLTDAQIAARLADIQAHAGQDPGPRGPGPVRSGTNG